jgi:hypothetical protein
VSAISLAGLVVINTPMLRKISREAESAMGVIEAFL